MAAALCRVPSTALRLQAATYLRQFENSEETFPVKVQVRPGGGSCMPSEKDGRRL